MSVKLDELSFGEAEVDFDIHLSKDDLDMATTVAEGVKSIEINNTKTEFGIEMMGDDIHISFGFGGVKVDSDVFFKELGKLLLREQRIKELKERDKECDRNED